MSSTDKLPFIREYFADFRRRMNRVEELYRQSFKDEARILCVVYIEHLASGRYYDGKEHSKRDFCRALCDCACEPFFAMIHPRQLKDNARTLDEVNARGPGERIYPVVEQIVQNNPGRFLTQLEVEHGINASPLSDKAHIVENLWRGSVAAICYDRIRCPSIHGPGQGLTLTFDCTSYDGEGGTAVDFNRLYKALRAIFKEVENSSLETGEWFGNPQYR